MSEVRKYRNTLVSHEDLGLWEGDVAPILDEIGEVDLRWKGGKIPARILLECLTWFRKVDEKYSSEAQARLGYNPETGEWCWVAFPQYVTPGLYSKEIPDDELTDEQRAMRLRATKEMSDGGFMEAGTIHSHCDAGAFASGIDDKDEITQNGVHITLGQINSEQPEIHGRVVFRKIKYPIHWQDWLAEAPSDLPENFRFTAREATIDEERLMGLCFERQKPELADIGPYIGKKWPSGSWALNRGVGTYGGGNVADWDGSGWDMSGDGAGMSGRRVRDPCTSLSEYVDSTLAELLDSYGFEDTLLEFIRLCAQRVIELDIFTPREVFSEVMDGIFDAGQAQTHLP